MIHLVFPRSQGVLKVFARDGSLWKSFAAAGDAWGNNGAEGDPPWGHNSWMPVGHYALGPVEKFATPIASEGYGQIPILDLDSEALGDLVKSGHAVVNGLSAAIGGLEAPLAQLAKYDRSALMIHGGGSNDIDPFSDYQPLLRTEGCTRMHNSDWRELAAWLQPLYAGNTIVYTALETPKELSD